LETKVEKSEMSLLNDALASDRAHVAESLSMKVERSEFQGLNERVSTKADRDWVEELTMGMEEELRQHVGSVQAELKKKISHNITLVECRSEIDVAESRMSAKSDELQRRLQTLGDTLHSQASQLGEHTTELQRQVRQTMEVETSLAEAHAHLAAMPSGSQLHEVRAIKY